MTRIVINACYGGFSLSPQAIKKYLKLKGMDSVFVREIERDDPVLISIVESLGPSVNGRGAGLKVVEIPDDIDWTIDEYDGKESIVEKHRTWR